MNYFKMDGGDKGNIKGEMRQPLFVKRPCTLKSLFVKVLKPFVKLHKTLTFAALNASAYTDGG